jgi:hypothetical protein
MSNTSKPKQRPSHEVFAVQKGSGDKNYWIKVGAIWPHEDAKGFNLKLDYLPLNGADLVIREPKAETQEGGGA